MLFTVQEFCEYVSNHLNDLIDELAALTGRSTPAEQLAWQRSLPALSKVFSLAQQVNADVGSMHLSLGHMSLEYKLPGASAWCDAILLGQNSHGKKQVVIIELKDWDTSNDDRGMREGLIMHRGQQTLHPSDQVKGYSLYCQRFHSVVIDHNAQVSGCVFFSRKANIKSHTAAPNHNLTKEYPVFDISHAEALAKYLCGRIDTADEAFAHDFKSGVYKQDRNILRQVAEAMAGSAAAPFELLDEQRKGFHLVQAAVDEHAHSDGEKKVIVVHGPPGSGKSALAANLWIHCARHHGDNGNIVFVTTSSSQKTNWQATFENTGRDRLAQGMVLPANQFNPGLSGQRVKKIKDEYGDAMDYQHWRECINRFNEVFPELESRSPDNVHFLSIVDEAHALINPEGHRIGFASGWCLQAGPQAYHIIRSSQISVFLLDSEQSYRDNETTSVHDIEKFAAELGAEIEHIDLSGQQFRCGGSKEYEQWVDGLLGQKPAMNNLSWRRMPSNAEGVFGFDVVDSLFHLEAELMNHHHGGHTVRLISSYSRPWKTKREDNIHQLPLKEQDFFFRVQKRIDGEISPWGRPWNYAPNEDYSMFIQATPGSEMARNPLAEVGCPYVVRGFEYDYLGLLWLDDLVWRNNRWEIQVENVHETALKVTGKAARQAPLQRGTEAAKRERLESIQRGKQELMAKLMRGYRILMTRAVKGIYVYAHDDETRDYLRRALNGCS